MKKIMILTSLLLCLLLLCQGCRGALKAVGSEETYDKTDSTKGESTGEENDGEETGTSSDMAADTQGSTDSVDSMDTSDAKAPGDFECIVDISDYWNSLYSLNEETINLYEGVPIMELFTPGMCFVTGVQYDVLNIFNKDGRHEGNLMLSGYPGFEEKKGPVITFGYEMTIEEDSEYSNSLAGDKLAESGNCNLDKGYYFSESYTEREGEKIVRSTNEFALQGDKSMCALIIAGSSIGYNNEENLTTTYTFIRAGKGLYDYVVAKSTEGTDFENLRLEKDMTKAMAVEMFEKAGAAVEYKGGIKDGTFYVE